MLTERKQYRNINFRQNISFSLKKVESNKRGKEGLFILIESTVHQEEIKFLNFHQLRT